MTTGIKRQPGLPASDYAAHVEAVLSKPRRPKVRPLAGRRPCPLFRHCRSHLYPMKSTLLRVADVIASPIIAASAAVMYGVRRAGIQHLPIARRSLNAIGVFPIRNHYYEPLFDGRGLAPLNAPRRLPGIDWNTEGQLGYLAGLVPYAGEIRHLPQTLMTNPAFGPGDSEMLYSIIRQAKPRRIVEVGSGYSTRVAVAAVKMNGMACDHVCIEPYEMPWLESEPVSVFRRKVEDVSPAFFSSLESGDILFIDSSHMIRPQGDVLTEFLETLPTLRPGVLVHVHDIFSPRDYPRRWVVDEVRLWNEQYLLEAFLSHNRDWEIVAALNYLQHSYPAELRAACPLVVDGREPGSFWMRRKIQ